MVTIKQLTKKRDALVSIVRNGVWAGWQLDMTDAGAGHRRLFLDVHSSARSSDCFRKRCLVHRVDQRSSRRGFPAFVGGGDGHD
mmetsp:Transcript_3105/g.7066  ORF Transcript_3105/g.7066 Transcript_3105/m.7066 type:complete len:84 (+) Transcript_3105:158-409(+)